MSEERSQVVHDFLFRRAGKKAYSLARLKAQTELAKLHREEFLELVHKIRDTLAPSYTSEAERSFQSLDPSEIDIYYDRVQWMKRRNQERRKARQEAKERR